MIHRLQLGKVPPKPHTTFYDDGKLLMEQCVTRLGFDGPFSILYYRTPPTDETAVEPMSLAGFCPVAAVRDQPLHRRHVRTQDLRHEGDFLTGRYRELAERVGTITTSRGAKGEMVRNTIVRLGTVFRISQIEANCPNVSRPMIRKVLEQLKRQGKVECTRRGPDAEWRKLG